MHGRTLKARRKMLIQYYQINFWVRYAVAVLIVVAAAEFGRWLGLSWRQRRSDALTAELLTLEGAALGLVALMIGFTFSMALTRFDARAKGVVDEANIIATTASRARALPEPHAAEVRKLLSDYVQVRVDGIGDVDVRNPLDTAIRRSGELQADLLRHAADVSIADPYSIPAGLFATSLSEMIDQQEVRLAAARNRVPPAVLFLLYGIALVGIGLSGYVGGLASRSGRLPHALMAFMVATVIVMVDDIDRPQSGLITVSQQPLINLKESLPP